jgi:hypothetical protein
MSADLIAERDALRLTVEVEQAKIAFRDKVIARLESRVTALEKALAELLDIRPGVTEPLVAKAAWMRAVALSAKGGDT